MKINSLPPTCKDGFALCSKPPPTTKQGCRNLLKHDLKELRGMDSWSTQRSDVHEVDPHPSINLHCLLAQHHLVRARSGRHHLPFCVVLVLGIVAEGSSFGHCVIHVLVLAGSGVSNTRPLRRPLIFCYGPGVRGRSAGGPVEVGGPVELRGGLSILSSGADNEGKAAGYNEGKTAGWWAGRNIMAAGEERHDSWGTSSKEMLPLLTQNAKNPNPQIREKNS